MEFTDPGVGDKRALSMGSDSFVNNTMELEPRPTKKRASNPQAANQRHIKTEQARRDKIAAGFQALQDLLPGRERVEKAMLLNQAASYITQLQAVLNAILSNGSIGKLPDDLQWKVRNLLPRKDAAARLPLAGHPVPVFGAGPGPDPTQPSTSGAAQSAALSVPFLPLLPQGSPQSSQPAPASIPQSKEMSKDENVLVAQVQAQLQQMQQQAAAAQQLQSWQQALQAIQLQQVLNQQQQGGAAALDPSNAAPFSSAPSSTAPLPAFKQEGTQQAAAAVKPESTFTELLARDPTAAVPTAEATQSSLQQLADVASGDANSNAKGSSTGSTLKARRSATKGRKTAASKHQSATAGGASAKSEPS